MKCISKLYNLSSGKLRVVVLFSSFGDVVCWKVERRVLTK